MHGPGPCEGPGLRCERASGVTPMYCSGGMYVGVPITMSARVTAELSAEDGAPPRISSTVALSSPLHGRGFTASQSCSVVPSTNSMAMKTPDRVPF